MDVHSRACASTTLCTNVAFAHQVGGVDGGGLMSTVAELLVVLQKPSCRVRPPAMRPCCQDLQLGHDTPSALKDLKGFYAGSEALPDDGAVVRGTVEHVDVRGVAIVCGVGNDHADVREQTWRDKRDQ